MSEKEEKQAAHMAQVIKAGLAEIGTAAYIERNKFIALDRRMRFLAHLEAGFTEAQALELVKN